MGSGNMAMMGSSMGSNGGNIMDSLKNNLMTMLMFKSINGSKDGSSSSSQDMFYMMYIFIITQLVDLFIKYIPIIIQAVRTKYFANFEDPLLKKISHVATDISDATLAVKTKSASIVINVGVSDHENIIGQALLDHITNNNNTKHIKYTKQNFVLNETEAICIDDDIFVIMSESKLQQPSDLADMGKPELLIQMFEIFSFVKSAKQLRKFLNNIQHNYIISTQNKLGTKRFYFNMRPITAPTIPGTKSGEVARDYSRLPAFFHFTMKEFQTNRKFSNLFGDEIAIIRSRVQFFLKNRKWYDEKGVPYTLGLLLSGEPGTGKTSCIKCLANETNRHIININLNSDITKTQVENLFFNESIVILNQFTGQNEKYNIPLDQRIYVLEDIDCQGDLVLDRNLTRIRTNKKDISGSEKMDMSFLLNLLDGVLETPGRIIIMTSNYPDLLDKALIRPGRIDIISKFQNCSNKTIIEMMEFFYNITLIESQKIIIHQLEDNMLTPAELSKIMFEQFGEVNLAIASLIKKTIPDLIEKKFKHEPEPEPEPEPETEPEHESESEPEPSVNNVKQNNYRNSYTEWKM